MYRVSYRLLKNVDIVYFFLLLFTFIRCSKIQPRNGESLYAQNNENNYIINNNTVLYIRK